MNHLNETFKRALFPEQRPLLGPVTASLRRRFLLRWLGLSVVGLGVGFLGLGHAWSAVGAGLVFPGSGFLYTASPFLALLTVVLFGMALVAWLLAGMFLAPVVVWLGSALLAGAAAGTAAWPWAPVALGAAIVALLAWKRLNAGRRLAGQLATARRLNADIVKVSIAPMPARMDLSSALSDQDLGAMRATLDLALQPIDRFDGFTTIDQFRESAWRYQLYRLSEALAMLRVNHLPAFDGYLKEAQTNAILKVTDRRVWSYWFWENLWGNLRVNADPMARENIMITGWYATALGAYQLSTGDARFDSPGSLPFRWSDSKIFEYDYPRMADALVRNFRAAPLCLYPCEPNWVFSFCNEEGMAGLVLYDRAHGTRHAQELMAVFRKRMDEEFTLADGRQVLIYPNRIGLPLASGGAALYAGSVWLRNIFAPDLAARSWAQVRAEYLRAGQADLFEVGKAECFDAGNYKVGQGESFYALLMLASREMGDDEVYHFARTRLDALGSHHENGALRWPGSTMTNLTASMARFGAHGAWHRLAQQGAQQAAQRGPRLASAGYPDVLVARAVSDGQALSLNLVPGGAGGRFPLGFSGLVPGRAYRFVGGADGGLVAGGDGSGQAELVIDRRIDVSLVPHT